MVGEATFEAFVAPSVKRNVQHNLQPSLALTDLGGNSITGYFHQLLSSSPVTKKYAGDRPDEQYVTCHVSSYGRHQSRPVGVALSNHT